MRRPSVIRALPSNRRKYRYLIGAVVLIVILVCGFRTYPPTHAWEQLSNHDDKPAQAAPPATNAPPSDPSTDTAKSKTDAILKEQRIAKASMLYGAPNELFERALKTHDKQDDRFGYPFAIMRQEITKGYWTKLSYLMSLIVLELGRPANERIEWIMWNDADAIVLNPQIPLSIFLPPADSQFSHINFVGSRNGAELDARTFFIRVDPWSVTFLVKAMAVPLIDEGAELGLQMDQNAMAFILNETEFRGNVFYQPHTWFNALRHVDGFEGQQGSMMAGFSADELKGERWRLMDEMITEAESGKFAQPLEATTYQSDAAILWDRVRDARGALFDAEQAQKKNAPTVNVDLMSATEALKEIIFFTPYDEPALKNALDTVRMVTQSVLSAANSKQEVH